MKKNYMIFLMLMCVTLVSAKVEKAVNLTSAGTLSSLIDAGEKSTITDLTITGQIDARDFKFMRDEMAVLANIDMSTTTIKAYSGELGTYFDGSFSYPANEIPNGAFSPKPMDGIPRGKATLKSVKMPTTITSIGSIAFANCQGLTGNLVLPNAVTIIKEAAFADCTGFNGTLTLPSGLIFIEKSAFQSCSRFTGNLMIPNNVTTIADFVFMSCSGFNGTLQLGNSLANIDIYAFAECSNFTEIAIPSSLTSITDDVFSGCSSVNSIKVENANPPTITSSTFDGINKNICIVTVPNNSIATYKSADYWKSFVNFAEKNGTGLSSIHADVKVKTNTQNHTVIIEGLPDNFTSRLFDISGKLLFEKLSTSGAVTFKVNKTGLFLVSTQKGTFKVAL